MKIDRLAEQEAALNDGLNELYVIDADDLTLATVSTAQTIVLSGIAVGDIVRSVVLFLKTPFQQTGTTAFNTTGVTVGDTGTANHFITTAETNANGTYIAVPSVGPASAVAPYATATNLTITFTPTSSYAVKALNVGELYVFVKRLRISTLANARASEPILTK